MGQIDTQTIRHKCEKHRSSSEYGGVDNLLISLADLLFPKFCIGCKKLGYEICGECLNWSNNEEVDFHICIVCENLCIDGETHKLCKTKSSIAKLITSYLYKGIIKKVLRAKSKNPLLIKTLLRKSQIKIPRFDLIIPIPSSPKYLSPRIIEPTDIITQHIQSIINAPIHKVLYKTAFAKQQKQLNIVNRQDPNIRILREAIPIIRNKSILLIDDVCTTGSTLNTSAKLLKQFGAKEVSAYTFAKDLRNFRPG